MNPGASIKVQYQPDKHVSSLYTIYNDGSANPTQFLIVTGQFDDEFDVEITSLLATYIEEHRNDDLLEVCFNASAARKL